MDWQPTTPSHNLIMVYASQAYTNTTVALSQSDRVTQYVNLVANAIGLLPFIVFCLITIVVLISKWKVMVTNKKLFYVMVVALTSLQVVGQAGGIGHAISKLLEAKEVIGQSFFMVEYEVIIITTVLSFLCQCLTTKVLFTIYFHTEQSWMRGKGSRHKHQLKTFVKWFTLIAAGTMTIVLVLLVPTILITLMAYYVPGVDLTIAASAAINRFFVDIGMAFVCLAFCIAVGIINMCLVVSLSRRLLDKEQVVVTEQKVKASKKLLLLSSFQSLLDIFITLFIIMACLSILSFYLFIIAFVLQRVGVFLFALALTFIYGPLDDVSSISIPKVFTNKFRKKEESKEQEDLSQSDDDHTRIRSMSGVVSPESISTSITELSDHKEIVPSPTLAEERKESLIGIEEQ